LHSESVCAGPQAAAEAAEIRTAQPRRMVVDAVLVVEAEVGRHLMSRHLTPDIIEVSLA
jgi:hypothetical protein